LNIISWFQNVPFKFNLRHYLSERVQGGFFTSVVDQNPDASEFIGESEGLTEVDILDFDETAYVNFEAEVHFPEEDGIIQIENFGIHINDEVGAVQVKSS
jgi:hypothetical protein